MTRITTKGRDPLMVAPQTQWQAQRMRGPIQPMQQERRGWWQFWRIDQ